MSTAKNQHFVPRFILNRFTTGKKRQIYVFDKQTDRTWRTSVRGAANENRFYDFELDSYPLSLEESLSELEDKAAPIIGEIVKRERLGFLSETERATLAYFMLVQKLRTPDFLAQSEHFDDMIKSLVEESGGSVDQIENFKVLTEEERKLFHIHTLCTMPQDLAPHLLSKTWCLLKTSRARPFYISDQPVTLQNTKDSGPRGNLGLACEGIEVYFPLSATLTLAMFCPALEAELRAYYELAKKRRERIPGFDLAFGEALSYAQETIDAFDDKGPAEARPENVENLNSLQVFYANRFVYSPVGNFDLVKDMISENENRRTGFRFQVA